MWRSRMSVVNQMAWMPGQYVLTGSDVYLQKTAMTFDVSLWGFFLPLAVGARLVVATHDGHRDPGYLASVIADQGVTVDGFVPSMLSVFAGAVSAESGWVRCVMCSSAVRRCRRRRCVISVCCRVRRFTTCMVRPRLRCRSRCGCDGRRRWWCGVDWCAGVEFVGVRVGFAVASGAGGCCG